MDTDTVCVYSKTNRGFATIEGEFKSSCGHGESVVDVVSAGIARLSELLLFPYLQVPVSPERISMFRRTKETFKPE